MTCPGVRHPPRGSRCVDGRGASGRPAAAGTGSGARSTCGTSAGATCSARVAGCAGAGVSCFTLLTGACVPWNALGARETAGALGVGVGLCVRSPADTTSSRGEEAPASCTSPPSTLARSCFRSSDNAGCSDEREHAAKVTRASVLIESRRMFRMECIPRRCRRSVGERGQERQIPSDKGRASGRTLIPRVWLHVSVEAVGSTDAAADCSAR